MCQQRVQRFASGTSGLVLCFLQSKKKVGKGQKELCLLQLCNHWHCFGHIWLWVTYSLDNNPNTKCCQQQRVVTSLMSQWQALSGQIPTPTKHGCCTFHCYVFTTLSFKMMGRWNFSSWKQQKMKPNLATSSCGMIAQTHDLPHKFEKYNTACIQLKKSWNPFGFGKW